MGIGVGFCHGKVKNELKLESSKFFIFHFEFSIWAEPTCPILSEVFSSS
jgi:hypothetical protein